LCGATQGVGIVLAQKVAMDEFLLAPFFNGGYLSYAALTSGESVRESLNDNFWDVMYADWMVWPSVMVVCFLKVPVKFRPGYVALVGVGWNTYLAYKAHSELTTAAAVADKDELVDPLAEESSTLVYVHIPVHSESLDESQTLIPLKMIRRTTTIRSRRRAAVVVKDAVVPLQR